MSGLIEAHRTPSLSRAVGYAGGNFGKIILWSAADLTLMFLLTDVIGLNPAIAGVAIFASLLVNACLDPVIGGVADRIRGPIGRNGPLIMMGAPLCSAAFVAIYTLPALGVSSIGLTMVALVLFRAGFALIDTPHNALIASMATSSQTRATLSGLRFAFSSLATLGVIFILPALFAARAGQDLVSLAAVATGIAALSMLAMIVSALAARPWDRPEPRWHFAPDALRHRATRLLGRRVAFLLGIILVINLFVPLFGRMIVYHAVYVVGDPDRARDMLVAMIVGQLAGIAPWAMLARRLSARAAISIAMAVAAMTAGAMALTAGISVQTDLGIALLFGFGAGGIYALIWLLVADAADEFARSSGVEAPALIFALAIVAIKVGQGVSAAATGGLLDAAGYIPQVSTGVSIGWAITALQAIGPLTGLGLGLILLTFLPPVRQIAVNDHTLTKGRNE